MVIVRRILAFVLAVVAFTACSGGATSPITAPTTSLASPSSTATTEAPVTTSAGPGPQGLTAPAPASNPAAPPADMLNASVTQATIHSTICVRGWTATVRPPQSYTEPLKRLQVASYGYTDRRLSSYEEDHAVALELGGNPTAKVNLWPEPHKYSVPDDGLESSLRSQVCSGQSTLAAAQAQIYAVKVSHGYDRAKSSV